MLRVLAVATLCAMAQPAFAQAVQGQLYASPEDVAAAIARSKAAATMRAEPVVALPPLRVAMEYRASPTPASVHEQNNELINVVEGSGTLIMGGKLKDEKRRDSANLNGSGIEGGISHPLVKGTYVLIPAGTAHHFSSIGSGGLVISTLYIPVAAKAQ